jgi:hypothetical protein
MAGMSPTYTRSMQCFILISRVHWACAGFEDETIPPDEWQCPDCIVKIAQGVHPALIEKAHAQDTCMRPTCIRRYVHSQFFKPWSYCWRCREKKKIIVKEGDEEEFYVEKYIGWVEWGSTTICDWTLMILAAVQLAEKQMKWLEYLSTSSNG